MRQYFRKWSFARHWNSNLAVWVHQRVHNLSSWTKSFSTSNHYTCVFSFWNNSKYRLVRDKDLNCSQNLLSDQKAGSCKVIAVLPILISAKKCTQHGVELKSIIKLQNHTLFSAGPTEAKFLFGGRRVPYNRKNNCARFNQKWKGSCECSLWAT